MDSPRDHNGVGGEAGNPVEEASVRGDSTHPRRRCRVVGTPVDVVAREQAVSRLMDLARTDRGACACVANVHMIMEAVDDPELARVLEDADMVTADGVPVAWSLRLLGERGGERVHGPWLLPRLCREAAAASIPVGFFGGEESVVRDLVAVLRRQAPGLEVVYSHCPPYRELTTQETDAILGDIGASGARIVFVGLGCPRQELWIGANGHRTPALMVGVGAAFDFVSGHKREPPRWMQSLGLGWLFRLACEPRRLWRRYLYHNPRFVLRLVRQLAGGANRN